MSDSFHSNRDLNIFQATTIAMPISMPIKHRLLTAAANSGSSVKKESTKPKIPVKKIMMTPHPTAALVAPKEAFFIFPPLFESYPFLSFNPMPIQLFSVLRRVFVISTSPALFNLLFQLVFQKRPFHQFSLIQKFETFLTFFTYIHIIYISL